MLTAVRSSSMDILSTKNARIASRVQAVSAIASEAVGTISPVSKLPCKVAQLSACVYSLFHNNTNKFEKVNSSLQAALLAAHIGLILYIGSSPDICTEEGKTSARIALTLSELVYSGLLIASFSIYETLKEPYERDDSLRNV